jgi:hypothetical protein
VNRAGLLLVGVMAAGGCTRANVGGGTPWLDGAVKVTAAGTRPRSEVSLQRTGALDPASSTMDVMINDASIALRSTGEKAVLDSARLVLDDIDLPPSADLPNGLQLRAISLELPSPLAATIDQAVADTLVVHVTTPLTVHSSMLLADGTFYKLGDTETEPGDVQVRVTTDGEAATVSLDATPPSICWSVGTPDHMLLQAQNCAVFVESFAQVVSQ